MNQHITGAAIAIDGGVTAGGGPRRVVKGQELI